MVNCIRKNQPVEGLTALPINVDVVEIIEAAKQSVKTGKAIPVPLKELLAQKSGGGLGIRPPPDGLTGPIR